MLPRWGITLVVFLTTTACGGGDGGVGGAGGASALEAPARNLGDLERSSDLG